MKKSPKYSFDLKESHAASRTKLKPVSLVISSVTPEWCQVFDVLCPVLLPLMGGAGSPSAYQRSKNGHLASATYECSYQLPTGTLHYSYKYRRGIHPRLTLSGIPLTSEVSNLPLKSKATLSDPKLMILLYLAQRKARSERGDCELCGNPLSVSERKAELWRHPDCNAHILYTKEEERDDKARNAG